MEHLGNILTLLGRLFGLVCLYRIYDRFTNPLSRIPGPEIAKWTNLIYTYYWFKGQIPNYIHRLHEEYGPTVRTSLTQIDICDINAAREIYKTKSRFPKSKWYHTLVSNNIRTVFSTTDTQFHSSRRRLLASPISDSSLTRFEPLISNRVQIAIDRIGEEMKDRGAADVFKWWLFMATDVIGELSFGESFRMLEAGKKTQYSLDLEYVSNLQPIRTTFPLLVQAAAWLPLPIINRTAAVGKRIGLYASQSIERYKKMIDENPADPKPTLFTKLFDAEKSRLTHEDIRQEAQGYIVAGSDTTAVTLTYLVYAVTRHPQIQEKLVAELATIPQPVYDRELRSLPYLNQIIKETLRLYTAVPFGLPRMTPSEGAHFNGYFVPGGTTVSSQAYSLHRDPEIFPEPYSFRPERWELPTKEMKDASLPFGGGARICLGMHLALIELRLASAFFFREYSHARPSDKEGMTDEDMTMKSFFLMAPQGHRCLIEA
ncbi:hypothetical protein N7462_001410 [Penicillium macrosclerotiorum]|uniref:uncharacterized protein n=1 Tax=Penicillium macrosclerotiorum TaxID=303699 RepID=UPI002548DA1D|nr:uncharacterized protein N7462_001410 [Penicillium macrosclerotiorum]KAJ5691987.1 hypothetical protein N7462_001410 [Penicillium macrosclerotiorum]